jgi:hypothetical protein
VFELGKCVGNHTNTNIDGFNIVLHGSDRFLDILERSVVAERLAGIIDLTIGPF